MIQSKNCNVNKDCSGLGAKVFSWSLEACWSLHLVPGVTSHGCHGDQSALVTSSGT